MNQERPTVEFDPYYRWLGIRDPRRPPNHYRLLGLELFETDGEVISAAADRQMAHVRSYSNGPHGVLSQHVLNEISAAKLCLLSPGRRSLYDDQLRQEMASAGMGAYMPPGAAVAAPAPPTYSAAPLSPTSFSAGGAAPASPTAAPIGSPLAGSPSVGVDAPPAAPNAGGAFPDFGANFGGPALGGGPNAAPAGLTIEDKIQRHAPARGWKALRGKLGVLWGAGLVVVILVLLANRSPAPSAPGGSAAVGSRAATSVAAVARGTGVDPLDPLSSRGGSGGGAVDAVQKPAEKLVEIPPPWKVHDGSVWQAATTLDGKFLITGGTDNLAKIFHLPDGKPFRELKKHLTYVQAVAATKNGGRFATASLDGQVHLWDPSQAEPVASIAPGESPIRTLAFSQDGAKLAGGDEAGSLHVWNAADGTVLADHPNLLPSKILSLAFLDGDHLLVAGEDPTIRLVDAASGAAQREFRGHKSIVTGVSYPGEGKHFASAGADGQLCWWVRDSRTPLRKLQAASKGLRAVALSPDGRLAAVGGDDAIVKIWDLGRGREIAYSNRLAGNIRSLAFSPAGDVLYAAGTEANLHRFTPPAAEGSAPPAPPAAPETPPEPEKPVPEKPESEKPAEKPSEKTEPPKTEDKTEAAPATSSQPTREQE